MAARQFIQCIRNINRCRLLGQGISSSICNARLLSSRSNHVHPYLNRGHSNKQFGLRATQLADSHDSVHEWRDEALEREKHIKDIGRCE